jgi:restriction system protein
MEKTHVAEKKQKGNQSEFVRWFAPLLQALKDLGGSAAPREASERVAEIEKISDALRNEVLRSGQERFHNQVCWARQYLVWEGLIDSGKRGVWTLTPKGLQTQLDAKSAREIFLEQVRKRAVIRKPSVAAVDSSPDSNDKPEDTPQSDEDASLESFLRALKGLSPNGFERLSMRLLREAGFERVSVTGRSNDGGIDGVGVLQLNDLVSFNVVFQCKKWEGSVPPKEIRDLRGAMAGRAEKGIFLTTSSFTSNARAEAERPGAAPIELVDGEKLFEMFKRYELGLKPRTVFDIDVAFFDQFR